MTRWTSYGSIHSNRLTPGGNPAFPTLIPDLWSVISCRSETGRQVLCLAWACQLSERRVSNHVELAQTPNDEVGRYSRPLTPLVPDGLRALIACANFVPVERHPIRRCGCDPQC